jgi:hypothetical protein
MTSKHLSDEEIQQWALDKTKCGTEVIAHMHDCEHCRAGAETYHLLFAEIKQLPNPVFDFDVPGLVLQEIGPRLRVIRQYSWLGYLIIFVSLGVSGAAVYLYRVQLGEFLEKYVFNISSGISKGTIYLLLVAALTILIFQSIELFRKYQRKIDDLNFY